ncbi:hypothetical protein LPTSP1_31880 [Leptospira johnsonii]|uniref:Uncharacterized protein n=1 Tax=Leptospira johnsonii TaxID=1917820 RepID=A0A2P2D696_9LEPT|nr:hypothetical protein LPTSP1_31880 [Leptospira johnsonii]
MEAKKAKSLAMECVKERNASIYKKLNRYIVQYVGLEAKEIKIVYINFFIPTKYDDPSRFSKSIPLVMDGGDRYFSLMLNLKNETCFNFHVNHEL